MDDPHTSHEDPRVGMSTGTQYSSNAPNVQVAAGHGVGFIQVLNELGISQSSRSRINLETTLASPRFNKAMREEFFGASRATEGDQERNCSVAEALASVTDELNGAVQSQPFGNFKMTSDERERAYKFIFEMFDRRSHVGPNTYLKFRQLVTTLASLDELHRT